MTRAQWHDTAFWSARPAGVIILGAGRFFPPGLPARLQLEFYCKTFHTAELNGVFYRTPTEIAVRSWEERTPSDFIFAWKASRFITHWKRLKDTSRSSLALLESRLRLLGDKTGPILFQLPPNFTKDRERLASFLRLLHSRRLYAFEFRHPSWYEDDILELLRDHNVALCISDHHDAPSPWVATASHVYVRGHGPGGRYQGRYRATTLTTWMRRLNAFAKARDIFVYFDND